MENNETIKKQKICYLVCLERCFNNGVIEMAVFNMLSELAKKSKQHFKISLAVAVPFFHINRKGIAFNFLKNSQQMSQIKKTLSASYVDVFFIPSMMYQYGIHLNPMKLIIYCLFTLPILFFFFLFKGFDIIHCRSYLSTFSAIICKVFINKFKVIFDLRGLFPEEGILQNHWKYNSISFLLWKKIEQWLLKKSDNLISLSETFSEYLKRISSNKNVTLVYYGTDTATFYKAREQRDIMRNELNLNNKIVFVFNGTLSYLQDTNLLANVFSCIQKEISNAYLLIFTNLATNKIEPTFTNYRIDTQFYRIMNLPFSKMPQSLAACDFGIVPSRDITDDKCYLKDVFNTTVGTKIVEYLSCGLPIIVNDNIGGILPIMAKNKIGTTFNSGTLDSLPKNIAEINCNSQEYANVCCKVAQEYFCFNHMVDAYMSIYNKMLL